MILKAIEAPRTSSAKGAKYIKVVGLALIALLLIKLVWISDLGRGTEPRQLIDFDVFHVVARMVWRGELEQAYHFITMAEAQRVASGTQSFMPWTYPPQFDLLIAPLAFLPRWLAYGVFTAGTLAAYWATLRRIAGEHFPIALIVLFPVFTITISCGQNGFLTGTLIGLACLGLQRGRPAAGLPLGLMVIKPHLAAALATYTLASRRWGSVGIAAATVVATSALATILLGTSIWSAVLAGTNEAKVFLENGMYPLFRMVSVYAALYTLGLSAKMAVIAQAVIAALSLAMICHAAYRKAPPRQLLGLTAITSLVISPYAYDYDLPIYGVGFALLLPDLLRLARESERIILYALSLFTAFFGTLQSLRLEVAFGSDAARAAIDESSSPVSLAGLTLVVTLVLLWRILRRDGALSGEVQSTSICRPS